MRLKFCIFLLLISPALCAICNLKNCYNVTSHMLETGRVELGEIENFNLTTDVIVLTGQAQENCSISLVCSSNFNPLYETKLMINLLTEQSTLLLNHTDNKDTPSFLITCVERTFGRSKQDFNMGIKFQFENSEFAQYYIEGFENREFLYYETDVVSGEKENIRKLLRANEEVRRGETEKISRSLTGTGCTEDFTVSLCPCSEPVITELSWNRDTETLHCTAASIEGSKNLTITWTENNISIHNVTEKSTELTKTSTLKNVMSQEISRNISCTVSMRSNNGNGTTRTITIPARADDSEHPDGEASKDTDGENTNSQAFLTILITIIVVSLVVVALVCVGVIKLVQRYKDNKTPEPPTLDAVEPTAGNSEVDEGALIHLYEEDRGSGAQIESNYQDLEDLLDAVEPRVIPTDEVPLYTEVNLKKPVEQENIYNRLDPKLMTVNRGDPDRWRTFRPGEAGASPHTMGASSNTRMVHQPPVSSAPPVPGTLTQGNNFCPAPEEGLYEMQTLKL